MYPKCGLFGVLLQHPGLLQRARPECQKGCFLMPAGPVAFAGTLYLDKIIAEFHRVSAAVHDVFE